MNSTACCWLIYVRVIWSLSQYEMHGAQQNVVTIYKQFTCCYTSLSETIQTIDHWRNLLYTTHSEKVKGLKNCVKCCFIMPSATILWPMTGEIFSVYMGVREAKFG